MHHEIWIKNIWTFSIVFHVDHFMEKVGLWGERDEVSNMGEIQREN